jgi:outer membrane protein, multidrug efflux system
VDDATVMIENINRHLEQGRELEPAVIEAANQIVIPTFVALLCISVVWLPLFQLSGVGGYLFLPLAKAIVFAMIASFILSRTLVPTMAAYLLRGQVAALDAGRKPRGYLARRQAAFEHRFERFRVRYRDVLAVAVAQRGRFIAGFLFVTLATMLLVPWLGQDFFPSIKSGEIDMHMRAPIGLRLEETSKVAGFVDGEVRRILDGHVTNIINNWGSGPFQIAYPQDHVSFRGDWWTLFGDPLLNQLQEQLQSLNPTLQAAAQAYLQARALAAQAQSQRYPQINSQASVSNNRQSEHRLFRASDAGSPNVEASNVIGVAASWEPDFWYAVRNRVHAQERLAQASAADLATVRLSLQAELANAYIALRGLDAELEVLRLSIESYRAAVEVTRLRAQGQIASGLDLARALAQLKSAEAQQTETQLERDLLQHAIAVLVGAVPSSFSIPPVTEFQLAVPEIPSTVPSALLQRRPDIASAERQMASANASIGVARAALYPNITFNASGGFQDSGFNLLSLPNSFWSIGALAVLPLFEGGFRHAELQRSWAQYEQTRDNYRQTVLAAFQEVEDGLSLTRRLATEVQQQQEASEQAAQASSISTTLYKGGLDNYLSVAVAQVRSTTNVPY